jgi:transcriptional regulator with XRE-family HTH domain
VASHQDERLKALGEFIRTQRKLGQLSLRQFANLARISNPYLSQLERGLHRPSAEVLGSIARALDIPIEQIYAQAGLLDEETDDEHGASRVEEAIRLDPRLTTEQKSALLGVYRGFVGDVPEPEGEPADAEDGGS